MALFGDFNQGITGLRDRATGLVEQGRGGVLTGLQRAQEVYKNGSYQELGKSLHGFIKDRGNLDVSALKDAGFGLTDKAGAQYDKRKKDAQRKLFDLSVPVRAKILFAIRESVKTSACADPDMFECVKRRIGSIVDLFWDDLTVYVETAMDDQKAATLGQVETDVDALGALGDTPCFLSPRWVRAFVLNHYLPYDRSIFGQIRDPVFWILTALSLVNIYGVRVLFFLFMLVLIVSGCPADEYQLVGYILAFKGTQFISSGVAMSIVAAVKYYLCVHPGGAHTCDVDGPGATQDFLSGIIDFTGSCILVWLAFLCLPCSARSAGMREVEDDEDVQEGGCCGGVRWDPRRGGRLAGLLGYDMVCFILACGVYFLLLYIDAGHLRPGGQPTDKADLDDLEVDVFKWEGHTALYWARIFYSFLAFPFTVFLLPGLSGILTHTTATGYNKNGLCVPFIMHEVKQE